MKFFTASSTVVVAGAAAAALADPLVYTRLPSVASYQPAFATQVVPTFYTSTLPRQQQQQQLQPTEVDEARATQTSQQYHKQDDFGNYAYGYADENSAKHEAGTSRSGGVVKGHYVYVDSHGLNRRVDYVADDQGFHAKSNRAKRSPALLDDMMTRRMSMRMVGVSGPTNYMANNNLINVNRMGSYRDNGVMGQATYVAQMMNGLRPYF